MSLTLATETGDVSQRPPRMRRFTLHVENRPPAEIDLRLDDTEASVEAADWPDFVAQVRRRELKRWQFSGRLDDPIGAADVVNLIRRINTTPSYQLFLAGIDIAERIELADPSADEQKVVLGFQRLTRRMPSFTGSGGIFFPPDDMLARDPASAEELVRNNKLCRATLSDGAGRSWTRFYVPYATPIGFTDRPQRGTEDLWDRVRTYYYAFR